MSLFDSRPPQRIDKALQFLLEMEDLDNWFNGVYMVPQEYTQNSVGLFLRELADILSKKLEKDFKYSLDDLIDELHRLADHNKNDSDYTLKDKSILHADDDNYCALVELASDIFDKYDDEDEDALEQIIHSTYVEYIQSDVDFGEVRKLADERYRKHLADK